MVSAGVDARGSTADGTGRGWGRSGLSFEVLVDEFDGPDVVAAVPQHPSEVLVEAADVAVLEAASVGDDPLEFERHFRHESEGASVRGLGNPDAVSLQIRERVSRQILCSELGLDGVDEVVAERAEVRAADA